MWVIPPGQHASFLGKAHDPFFISQDPNSPNFSLPTRLLDLEQLGLLDTTLVIWMGEFGRTPRINENASRDHWPQCYTVLLAGGGVKRGYVHGESNRIGAYPVKDPVRPDDLAATVYDLLGIDPGTEIQNAVNRPVLIFEGRPIHSIYA